MNQTAILLLPRMSKLVPLLCPAYARQLRAEQQSYCVSDGNAIHEPGSAVGAVPTAGSSEVPPVAAAVAAAANASFSLRLRALGFFQQVSLVIYETHRFTNRNEKSRTSPCYNNTDGRCCCQSTHARRRPVLSAAFDDQSEKTTETSRLLCTAYHVRGLIFPLFLLLLGLVCYRHDANVDTDTVCQSQRKTWC